MGDAGFFKGTSSEQDTRFKDKEKSLLKSINFPKELDQKVNMRKVELSVMRPWISDKIVELLGFEDEVVVEYVNGLLDDPTSPIVDPKRMQISLTGFLESKTGAFMAELWALLLSAQQSPLKIPALFIEQKKEEMRKKEEADLEAQAALKQRQEQEEEKERKLAEIRRRERGQGNNRNSFDNSQRNGSRVDGVSGYPPRGNFMPPRGRDSGWGSRGGAKLPDNTIRDPPSGGKRDRSRSRSRTRRDPQAHKGNTASSRRSRSPSRSPSRSRHRSRSRSPPRRTQRRASPSPRPHRRRAEAARSRKSRSRSRHRSRSHSPPSRRTHRKASPSPRLHRRRAEAASSRRSRSRHRSRSRSPPPRRTQRKPSPSPRPHRRHAESSKSHRRGSPRRDDRFLKSDEERSGSPSSPPRSSPRRRSISRSPPRASRQQPSTVISIKGRASKLTIDKPEHLADKSEAKQPMPTTSGEEKNHKPTEATNQTRSRNLTEVVKERLLREKVKASMNQI